jgi:hypothetical protein
MAVRVCSRSVFTSRPPNSCQNLPTWGGGTLGEGLAGRGPFSAQLGGRRATAVQVGVVAAQDDRHRAAARRRREGRLEDAVAVGLDVAGVEEGVPIIVERIVDVGAQHRTVALGLQGVVRNPRVEQRLVLAVRLDRGRRAGGREAGDVARIADVDGHRAGGAERAAVSWKVA